jgi:hypothetical protein
VEEPGEDLQLLCEACECALEGDDRFVLDVLTVVRLQGGSEVFAAAPRRAADRLGTDEFTAEQYERARQGIEDDARRRYLHGAQALPMPTADMIRTKAAWVEIMREAGLSAPRLHPDRFLPRSEGVRLFIEHYGFRPRQQDLAWFGRHVGIAFVHRQHEPHKPAIAVAAERFAAEGRWFPPFLPRSYAMPENWQQYGDGSRELAALAVRYRRRRTAGDGYSMVELREAIGQAFDALKPGERMTVGRYREISTALGLPGLRAMYRVATEHDTSFGQMVRDEAAARALAVRRRQ